MLSDSIQNLVYVDEVYFPSPNQLIHESQP